MNIGAVSLVFSALALGVAAFAVTRESEQPQRAPMRAGRVADLERQVAELLREVEDLKADRPDGVRRDTSGSLSDSPRIEDHDGGSARPAALSRDDKALAAIVDDAVDRKTKKVIDKLRAKANKKPAFNVFASVLELTAEQRAVTERVIVEGQRKVHEVLNAPTSNGVNLMDELIDVVAMGIVKPGQDNGWGKWVGRLMSENIPGTNETYAVRLEAIKNDMQASFKTVWSKEQYKEFEEWRVNPTEIENVPGSPNDGLAKRITDRVKELGGGDQDD